MVLFKRITDMDDPDLARLMELYVISFPDGERRDVSQLKRMMLLVPEMFVNAVYYDGELSGLVVYWDFKDFYYMEHLAVFPEMRNRQIGKQILDYWAEHLSKLRILEVEPANDEMAIRRINFYNRNGYQVIDKDYVQPSYHKNEDGFPLWIMGNEPHPQIKRLVETIKEEVYRKPLFI